MTLVAGYRAASTLVSGETGSLLELETALGLTPHGLVEQPRFFSGLLARPDVAAAGVLAVADVAGSRYFDAGLMKRLANLDPVVTASGDRLGGCGSERLEQAALAGEAAVGLRREQQGQPGAGQLEDPGAREVLAAEHPQRRGEPGDPGRARQPRGTGEVHRPRPGAQGLAQSAGRRHQVVRRSGRRLG